MRLISPRYSVYTFLVQSMHINLGLEGTVSRDFWPFLFLLKRFDLGPIWTGENGFTHFFVFAKIFAKNMCLSVSVVNDYADTVSAYSTTTQTPYLDVFTYPIAIILNMKISVSKEKIGCPLSRWLRKSQFSNFAIEYLREMKKFRKTVFACSYGAQVESSKPKKWLKIWWHCPFKGTVSPDFWITFFMVLTYVSGLLIHTLKLLCW